MEFFKTGQCYLEGYIGLYDPDNPVYISPPEPLNMDLAQAKRFAAQILGRVCHLLADMSVPAHVKNDLHPCSVGDRDTYELFMGNNLLGGCNDEHTSFPAEQWTTATATAQGGLLTQVLSMSDYDAIRYLFYTTSQIADHFPSDDAAGNNALPNGTNSYIDSRYQLLGNPPAGVTLWTLRTSHLILP